MISGCMPQKTAVIWCNRWHGGMGGRAQGCLAHLPEGAPDCLSVQWRIALHVPMQCAAMPDGARCTCQRSALRFPAEKTAVRGAAWQVGLHASLSTCREFLPPGCTVQSAFLLFPLGTQAGPSFPSSAKAEARHMRWHGLASWVFSAGQSGCLCGVWGCVRAP